MAGPMSEKNMRAYPASNSKAALFIGECGVSKSVVSRAVGSQDRVCWNTRSYYKQKRSLKSRRVFLHASASPPPSPSSSSSSVVENVSNSIITTAPLSRLLDAELASPRFVLVGGKGGVGKTSTSAAVALQTARAGFKTLVVSTDPAHSLGDALQLSLSSHRTVQIPIDTLPPLSAATSKQGELHAMEIDTEQAAEKLRSLLSRLSGAAGEGGGGMNEQQRKLVEQLGLAEFGEVFGSLPPGADELVAMTEMLSLAEQGEYERVVIDTAPTGHTLRMLAFPDFVDTFLEKALRLKEKVAKMGAVMNVVKAGASVLGGGVGGGGVGDVVDVKKAVEEIEAFRVKLGRLSTMLRNPSSCEFVVVTIATKLAADESERLVDALTDDGVWVRNVVINQLLSTKSTQDGGEEGGEVMKRFVERVRKEQLKSIARFEEFCRGTECVASDENGGGGGGERKRDIQVVQAPLFDAEIRDMYALRAFAGVALKEFRPCGAGDDDHRVVGENVNDGGHEKDGMLGETEFVLVGGKGGVGKTTSSAALGVKFADEGLRTLLVSTDPAHSLGDALEMKLTTGAPQRVDAYDVVAVDQKEGGLLHAMEIDTKAAVDEFRRVVAAFGASDATARDGGGGGVGSEMLKELGVADLATILDNTPPGIDELLALVKVVQLVRGGEYDRVVIDTAPTGHTLRLLAFPAFLDGLIGKVLKIKRRIDGLLSMFSGGILRNNGAGADAMKSASEKMEKFRDDMSELRALLRNPRRCQFAVVTIPTELAVAESERLVASLEKERVRVRNVVINQCVPASAGDAYAQRRTKAQAAYVQRLYGLKERAPADLEFTLVPYSDVELRGIFGLKYLSDMLFTPRHDSSS